MKPDNILINGGAIGTDFLVFCTLVDPSDAVISIFPAYQQLYSAAKSFGAEVKLPKLRKDNQWLPDVNELTELIDDKTKRIVINNPHNPSGSLIDVNLLKEIYTIAEDAVAYLLCNESYKGPYTRPLHANARFKAMPLFMCPKGAGLNHISSNVSHPFFSVH